MVESATVTAASGPDARTLLATPTETSNSSPGATATGALGESTKSPRTRDCTLATPRLVSLTATAITRSAPLKVPGTW